MTLEQTAGNQRGFSLNEALIAIVILSSGLLTLAQFQTRALEGSSESKLRTAAMNLVRQKLEELRGRALTDYPSIATGREDLQTHPGDTARFSRHWTVTSNDSPAYKTVRVSANWTSADGEPQSVSVSSLISAAQTYSGRFSNETDQVFAITEKGDPAPDQTPEPHDDTADAPQETADRLGATSAGQRTAVCLCQRSGAAALGRLDARSSDPNCNDRCCQETSGIPCPDGDCQFVARCPSG